VYDNVNRTNLFDNGNTKLMTKIKLYYQIYYQICRTHVFFRQR